MQEVALTKQEYQVFSRIRQAQGAFVTAAQIAEAIYADREDGGAFYANSIINLAVMKIRRKFGCPPLGNGNHTWAEQQKQVIQNLHGRGWRLNMDFPMGNVLESDFRGMRGGKKRPTPPWPDEWLRFN